MHHRLRTRLAGLVGALALLAPLTVGVASAAEPAPADPPPADHDDHDDHDGHDDPPDPDPGPVTEETFELGPMSLAPQGQPGDSFRRDFVEVPRPEGDIAVRSIDWEFVGADGQPIARDAAHLHHVVLLDTSRRDSVCANATPRDARFAGTGSTLDDFTFEAPHAYTVPADAPWQAVYMVMNTSDAPLDVTVRYTVGYTDAAAAEAVHLDQYSFDVAGCWNESEAEFDVPGDGGPGSIFELSRTITMQRDGILKYGGGHLHEGGIDLALTGPDGEVCRSAAIPVEGHDGHHSDGRTAPCPALDEEFVAGDEYTVTVRYHNDRPVLGAMGNLGIYAQHTSPPPAEPTVDVAYDRIEGAELVGTVTCEPQGTVELSGYVFQEGDPLPVQGGAWLDDIDCGPEPTTFRLRLVGDGALIAGTATYSLSAYATDGSWASDHADGEVHLTGRSNLGNRPPDEGPLPIEITPQAGQSPEAPIAEGTITCAEPEELIVEVHGWQAAGRYHLPLFAYQQVSCDGTTAYAIPFTSRRGQLLPGPATVTVTAYAADWSNVPGDDEMPWEPPVVSQKTSKVEVRSSTPEPDFRPVRDPDVPIDAAQAWRVDDGELVIAVNAEACDPGSSYSIDVDVFPTSSRIRNRWWNPTEFATYGYTEEEQECTGEPRSSLIRVSDPTEGGDISVRVGQFLSSDDDYGYHTNGAVLTPTTK